MLALQPMPWLWFFGATVLGILVGWITNSSGTKQWVDRPVQIAGGFVAIGAIVAIAKILPSLYAYWIDLGALLAVALTLGCFVGWALRDLADFMPAAAKPKAAGSAAITGSYLFRDAFAGMGSGAAYMRTPNIGGIARERSASSAGSVPRSPAPGGFTGSKGGYVFPIAMEDPAFAGATRSGKTLAGLYKHWTWRGVDEPDAFGDRAFTQENLSSVAVASGSAFPAEVSGGWKEAPVGSEPAGPTPGSE